MGYVSDTTAPEEYGKIFSIDAKLEDDLEKIKNALIKLEGMLEVTTSSSEFIIKTSKIIEINIIETEVNNLGFHVISNSFFDLIN